MKYKIGQKVKIIDYKIYLYNRHWWTNVWYLLGGLAMNEQMAKYCGRIMTITSVDKFNNIECYTFKECKDAIIWSEQLIECSV